MKGASQNPAVTSPVGSDEHSTAGIDVAIPCYQYGHFLRDCVESVLAQQVSNIRVLIIDNASTDNSLEVAQQLAAENAAVQVLSHRRNLGPHASFNEAVDWAAQKYFLLLCADDLVAPGALLRAATMFDRHPEVVLGYGRAALRGFEGQPVAEAESRNATWRILSGGALLSRFCGSAVCHIAGCTAVVRTEVQKKVGYYRPALPHTDDFEMWMRFACRGAVAETSAVQGVLRAHEACQSAFARDQHRWDILHCKAALESFFAHEGRCLPDAVALRRLAKGSCAARAYWSAVAHFTRGEFDEAAAILLMAIKLRPTCAVFPPFSYLLRRADARERLTHVLARALTASEVTIGSASAKV